MSRGTQAAVQLIKKCTKLSLLPNLRLTLGCMLIALEHVTADLTEVDQVICDDYCWLYYAALEIGIMVHGLCKLTFSVAY